MQQRLFYTSDYSKNYFFTYILGFQPSAGIVLLSEDTDQYFINVFLDARYEAISHTIPEDELAQRLGKPVAIQRHKRKKALPELLEEHLKADNCFQDRTLLVETSLPVGVFTILEDNDWEVIVDDMQRQLEKRAVKTNLEAKIIDAGNKKMEKLWQRFQQSLKEFSGKTEQQIAQLLYNKAIELGATGPAFPTIVAFGKNSAIPHYQTGDTVLQSGPLLVDMGWIFDGYCTDSTRCFWIGEKDGALVADYEERTTILSIVQKAHSIGIKAAKPGVSINELVEKVRGYLDDEGYEQYFTHALGHGVGVTVHELPRIGKSNDKDDKKLQRNNSITIEPGVYLPGKFGIRRESLICV